MRQGKEGWTRVIPEGSQKLTKAVTVILSLQRFPGAGVCHVKWEGFEIECEEVRACTTTGAIEVESRKARRDCSGSYSF